MKSIKIFSLLLLVIGLIISCKKDKINYREYFNINQTDFIKMKNHIDSMYINNSLSQSLIFLDCKKFDVNSFIKEKCDSILTTTLSKIGVDRIEVEHYYKCDYQKPLNKISFRVLKDEYYPVVYIVYEYCKNDEKFISNTFEKHPLGDNWYFTVDKNLP